MGSRTERLLLEDARELGWEGIKVDMGTGHHHVGHDAGDLIIGEPRDVAKAGVGGVVYSNLFIIEEKYKSTDANKYLQADGEKVDAMIQFAENIGATPLLAVRWSTQTDWSPGPTHYLIDIRKVERTKAGNISVKPSTAEKKFESTERFFG